MSGKAGGGGGGGGSDNDAVTFNHSLCQLTSLV